MQATQYILPTGNDMPTMNNFTGLNMDFVAGFTPGGRKLFIKQTLFFFLLCIYLFFLKQPPNILNVTT